MDSSQQVTLNRIKDKILAPCQPDKVTDRAIIISQLIITITVTGKYLINFNNLKATTATYIRKDKQTYLATK